MIFQYAPGHSIGREAGVFARIFEKQTQFQVLLQKRLCDKPKGTYGIRELPGGGIQAQDSSLNEALKREVQEELVLDISGLMYHKMLSIPLVTKAPIAICFLEVSQKTLYPQDTEEACDARFFPLDCIGQEMLSQAMRSTILPKIERVLPQL